MQEDYKREEPQKVHIGDIILNEYASERNPHRQSIVIAIGPTLVTTVAPYKGRISKANFALRDIQYNIKFNVIGHADIAGGLGRLIHEATK